MYSDLLESPSKDCFSFNDQSSSYNMAEMNEISSQVNLDYIFDSYYSSISRYNTGFELPEDCKNMSFSELFDQELFSTNENKDCKITIKIEKEEPLKPCYSADDFQETTDSLQMIKTEENSSYSPKLSKCFAPKLGIYRTSIKSNENSSVNHLIDNPFCETNEDLEISRALVKVESNIKLECSDVNETVEEEIVGMEIQIKEESKFDDSDNFHYSDTNYNNIASQEIPTIVKNEINPIETYLNDDNVDSQFCLEIKNEINSETEKKKISWEEFRAKREKMGLLKVSGNNEELNLTATDNCELEAIKKEFDRNTAEHFIGQKRKRDIEEQNVVVKETSDEDFEELQKKRLKIEYIKQLLPSSFASEIAKTSSLMKGLKDNEHGSISDDSLTSSEKITGKYTEKYDDCLKKDAKLKKKSHQTRAYLSHRSSRSSRSSSSSSSTPDDYYNRNRIDVPQLTGQYGQNIRNIGQRPKEQKRVVYVGQIPIKYGKRYLYNRFKEFGTILSLTLHKKPDFRVYYAFVTYSEKSEAERAISHGNDSENEVQLDIRFGERKQTQTPYYDLDDEWLTDWYGYNQPLTTVVRTQSPEKVTFEEELQEFYKLAQIKKLNQIKSSQIS